MSRLRCLFALPFLALPLCGCEAEKKADAPKEFAPPPKGGPAGAGAQPNAGGPGGDAAKPPPPKALPM